MTRDDIERAFRAGHRATWDAINAIPAGMNSEDAHGPMKNAFEDRLAEYLKQYELEPAPPEMIPLETAAKILAAAMGGATLAGRIMRGEDMGSLTTAEFARLELEAAAHLRRAAQ